LSYVQVVQNAVNYFGSYILPYLVVLAIAFMTTAFALVVIDRGRKLSLKGKLRAELRSNSKVTRAILNYADTQLSGGNSVAPMPLYITRAFRGYSNAGLLEKLHPKIAEELTQIYMCMTSVNKAGKRQEELAFGPSAAFPNAHTLRLENLTFARDTAHNIIEPYQDRLRDVRL